VIESPGSKTQEPRAYFETRRLLARSFTAGDVEAFVAYRADPDVARYQGWSDFTPERGEAFVESLAGVRPGEPGQWFQFALEERSGGVLVGDLALKVDADEPREAEVGFTLAPAHQGKGYATEALEALIGYAFESLGLHRVVAVTDARNAPAAALLERVGMRREGHFIENVFFKGAWGSEFLFAILQREWSGGR
jgi:RimJ/RimL family protein N-acetyltransferase